jgi:tRNA/rRNA methyltransferase
VNDLRVVLVSPRNPLNIGAVARAMSNFGFTVMRLVNPYDVAFREARSAVNAHYVLEQAEIFSTLATAVADCGLVIGTTAVGNRDLTVPLYSVEAAAGLLREQGSTAPAALLFGSEKFGLSNDDLSHCNFVLRIPTREEHGSMNLGQAAAICLYELRRSADREAVRYPTPETAASGDQERFTESLLEILRNSSYINERTAESSELKIRRLVRRLRIPAGDIETWLGVLRQILWKAKQ